MEDRQEPCTEICYVMGKCIVILLNEHNRETHLKLGEVGRILEELPFKARPEMTGQERDGEKRHGGKREMVYPRN